MAFNWLKRIVTAPVRLVSSIVKSPTGRTLGTLLGPIIDLAAPAPVRKLIKGIGLVLGPVARIIKPKGANRMNKIERALRDITRIVIEARKKSGLELAMCLVPMMLDIKSIMDSIHDVPPAEWLPEMRAALDGLIGSEANAMIGPGDQALIKVDVPYVGLEAVSDLILQGAENAILAKLEQPN